MKRTEPKTSTEAEQLMRKAIECEDYKSAKYFHSFIDNLKIYEQTVGLSEKVANYLEAKDDAANETIDNIEKYYQDIENAKQFSVHYYQQEFRKIRSVHRLQLEEYVEKWDAERQVVYSKVNDDYKQTLTTAKLVADTLNFDAAIKLQEDAEKILKFGGQDELRAIDKKNKKTAEMILDRQKDELQNLKENRDMELALFDELREAAKVKATEEFFVRNAHKVQEIVAKFPKDISAPLFLKMQIRKEPITAKTRKPKNNKSYAKFSKSMKTMNRTFHEPVDV